mgnify:CR=1 FL=1
MMWYEGWGDGVREKHRSCIKPENTRWFIPLICPKCGTVLRLDRAKILGRLRCPECEGNILIRVRPRVRKYIIAV